jgi:multiple sugar transport system ATP-binding protein
MTVYDNMAFGLKLRKMPKDVINEKVNEAAEILGLTPYLKRKPKALSGGQRQRVALGRAIVRNAKVFLMDEPLSNLDAKLRVQMRGELIKLHNKIETTTIYVTHDQIEAMTMASRIVVMKDGYIMQVGAPKEIYDHPNNMFVAGFIGTPPMNFIFGKVSKDQMFVAGQHKLLIPDDKFEIIKEHGFIEKEVVLGIRPEDIHDDQVVMETYPKAVLDIIVDVAELLGSETNLYTNINGNNVCASINARAGVHIGDKMKLAFDMNKVHFFDPSTEQVLKIDINKAAKKPAKKEEEKA